jgi:hypothetical protein
MNFTHAPNAQNFQDGTGPLMANLSECSPFARYDAF